MAVQSIWTPVQVGDVAGNHLLVAPCEMPFGEMDSIRELDHLPQEIGPRPKTLNDSGNVLPAGTRAPKIIGRSCFPRSLSIFSDSNFRR